MVFGPMKIFWLRVIAWRTSFSLTNSEISTLRFAGFGDGGAANGFGAAAPGASVVGVGGAPPDKPDPRAMPCAESTCSTKRASTARSGSAGDGESNLGEAENAVAGAAGAAGDGEVGADAAVDGFLCAGAARG